jgi:RNA ligase (TIGR02306 family)
MSTLSVEVKRIVDVQPHPNADRLEMAQIEGWWCVVGKGKFQKGDPCVYFPVDSILPEKLELTLFPPDSKIKLDNHRIKSIRIRQAYSQGLAVPINFLFEYFNTYTLPFSTHEGADLTAVLGVSKYAPPPPPATMKNGKIVKKYLINDDFHKYTDIENIRKYLKWFNEDDIVVAHEKIHGTNYRVGWVPNKANTTWKKFLNFFGLLPKYEFCFGSRNLQLTLSGHKSIMSRNPFVPKNAYERITIQGNFKQLLKPGEVLYGEIYGPDIQKGYHYGLKSPQLGFAAFDVEKDGRFLSDDELEEFCNERGIPRVPKLYEGKFNLEELLKLTKGNSIMVPSQKIMEGIVVRPKNEVADVRGRKIAKLISEEYSLRDDITEYQ